MKKQDAQNNINLEKLAGGAFAEKLNEALMEVAENIQDPNTLATAKRSITVSLNFTPSKYRNMVKTTVAVKTKLAAAEEIETQMIMGRNMRTGQIEFAEYDGQIPGQMSLSDYDPTEKPEPQVVETAASEPEQVQQPTGKPLDLRNRGKKLVPGEDFDPVTGEVYETDGQTADDHKTPAGRVVPINKAM